jgi:hypothetical protein
MKRQRDELTKKLEDSVLPKERQTLLKILLGMARAKFNHEEGSHKTVSVIVAALNRVDLSVGDDSIRKYLREADELFAK